MAPAKRKRNDRSSIDSSDNRPSPHRPGNTNLGQHDARDNSMRRSSRGGQGSQRGRGGMRGRSSDGNSDVASGSRTNATTGPMSPPPRPPSAVQTPSATPADTPARQPTPPQPRPDPAPFEYTYVTDEKLAAWETTDQQELVAAAAQMLGDEDSMELASILQELIRATLDVRLEATVAGNCVKEILELNTAEKDISPTTFDPETLFIDTLSMMVDAEPGASDPKTFPPFLRTFAVATGVSPDLMRQKLDATLAQNLGLTRETFIRVGIRQATHLLYRQANYNLLREETEGYSKLVTELFTTSQNEPPSAEVVGEAFEKVKGLIGTFDLDVGRVLDITMDIFAAVLIKHFRFFIKLLRVSSWWPRNGESDSSAAARCAGLPKWALPSSAGWITSEEDEEVAREQRVVRDMEFWKRARLPDVGVDAFFELGGRSTVDAETRSRSSANSDSNAELDADRQWIETTGTFPPSGNRIAAQLLGFKLRFYASAARDKDDILPANLIYLTALLIKIGFISLKDLYQHLWPLDEDMENVREAKMKELDEKDRMNRPGGGANALMMAGALVDDTLPNGGRGRDAGPAKTEPAKAAADVEDKDKLDEPIDQKVQLLTCLLTIGALPESLFILGRFPWLPEAYPDLYDLIHRILNHSINDVFNGNQPTHIQSTECPTKEIADLDQSGVPKGEVRSIPILVKKQLRWPFPDKADTNESNSYRFYWDEWADNVPVCQSVEDVFTLCGTLLNYSGVNIGRDPSLLSKLVSIGVKSLSTDSSPENRERWRDLLKRLLVPALSFTKANTSVANEIYLMLRFYPVAVRYSIYAEWYEGATSRIPAMKSAFARTRLETLGIMKRISMTNLTAMARSLAKAAFASPGIVFKVALSQIESYTNLTEVVVECAKYFTDLGYDVLVWSLLSSLGGDRDRNNSEFALLPSRWLLALSQFSGRIFKRYSIMDLSPIIMYVNDQLYQGNYTDLVILKELIAQMAGVVPDTDFTDAQLTAMTGGEVLRRQTLIGLQDRRYESDKTAKRLMKSLTESKLAGQLLISIAQHRQAAIYRVPDENAHIKLLATMIDDTQVILFQYLDLLRTNLSLDDFDLQVPAIPELLLEFGLNPTLAFMIGRPSLSNRMSKITSPITHDAPENATVPSPAQIDADGDVPMSGEGAAPVNGNAHGLPEATAEAQEVKTDVEIEDAKEDSTPSAPNVTASDGYQDILDPIIASVQELYPEDSWNAVSPDFYVTFWTATLADLAIPGKSYEAEILRTAEEQRNIMKDRTDMTRAGMAKKEETKKHLDEIRTALTSEYGKEVGAYRQRKARLLRRKSVWFKNITKADVVSDSILEKCLIPRLLLSPSDADFCFKMIKFLHENNTPNFRTLSLYVRIFKTNRLRSLIFSCTVREAENLARFLKLVLGDLTRWHADASVYKKEAWGPGENLVGFAKALDSEGKPKGLLDYDGKQSSFRTLLLGWHRALNGALRDCLQGSEWMHIRNAITILKGVVDVFPMVDFMGNNFVKQLDVIATREKDVREDLSLTGNAVLVMLKKKSKSWVMVQGFGSLEAASELNGNAAKTTPLASKSGLKPTAPEFKPQSRASSPGASTPKTSARMEVEDGEVDDAKVAHIKLNPVAADKVLEDKKAESPAPAIVPTPAPVSTKSEILLNRERHKAAQAGAASAILADPSRPDSRNSSNPPNPSLERPVRNLPNRPEGPIPDHRELLHPRYGDRRDGKDPGRNTDPRRLDRPGDRPGDRTRDSSREFSGHDRRPEPSSRDMDRSSERFPGQRPNPPPRWMGPDSAREVQNRSSSRSSDTTGRLSHDNTMLPPRHSERGPPTGSDKLPMMNPERQEIINPERAALITTNTPPRSDSPRRSRDEPRDRVSSRQHSPRRHGSERDYSDSRRDDWQGRNGAPDFNARGRPDDSQSTPVGPRSDRTADRLSDRGQPDRLRDSFQQNPSAGRLLDPDHGRLNAPRQQSDPNYGRLNAGQTTADPPSGPRDGRSQRSNRAPSAIQTRGDNQPSSDIPSEKPVPTGPAGNWSRRSASGHFDQQQSNNSGNSVPTTPISGAASSPIHPERLRHLSGAQQQAQASSPIGVHPDRLKVIEKDDHAVAHTTPSNQSQQPLPPIVTAVPPSGPKGSQSSPASTSGNGFAAPTGPASASERSRPKRQLAGINNMLQQAVHQSGSNFSVRGRSGRMSGQADPSTSAPSSPHIPSPTGHLPPVHNGGRDGVNQERLDLITGNVPSGDEYDQNSHDRKGGRSDRHRRGSPGADRSREPRRGLEEERTGKDYSHRRDSGRNEASEREKPQGRGEMGRELMPGSGREPGGSSNRDTGRDRERDARRDGRERGGGRESHENWAGNERGGSERGGHRGEPRGGDQRREGRNPRPDDFSHRKRHNGEDATNPRDKRPRR